jgi:hypothetical protein
MTPNLPQPGGPVSSDCGIGSALNQTIKQTNNQTKEPVAIRNAVTEAFFDQFLFLRERIKSNDNIICHSHFDEQLEPRIETVPRRRWRDETRV